MPFFTGRDGTQLRYEDWGTGKPVVFLHSWLLNAGQWEYQFHALVEAGLRCVGYDRRGHGGSDPGRGGYDYDTLSDDLAALLETLDLRDVTLVGHSMGSAEIARHLSRHGSGRIERVVFVSGSLPFVGPGEDNPEGLPAEAYQAFVNRMRTDRPKFFADWGNAFFATHLGNPVSTEAVDHMVAQALRTNPLAALRCWDAVFHTDLRPDLAHVTVPALIIHGTGDLNAPVETTGRRTAKLIPHSTLVEYDGAGHGLHETHADRLNADLLAFIAG